MADIAADMHAYGDDHVFSETESHDCCFFCYLLIRAILDTDCGALLEEDEETALAMALKHVKGLDGVEEGILDWWPHFRSIRNNTFDWCSHTTCKMSDTNSASARDEA